MSGCDAMTSTERRVPAGLLLVFPGEWYLRPLSLRSDRRSVASGARIQPQGSPHGTGVCAIQIWPPALPGRPTHRGRRRCTVLRAIHLHDPETGGWCGGFEKSHFNDLGDALRAKSHVHGPEIPGTGLERDHQEVHPARRRCPLGLVSRWPATKHMKAEARIVRCAPERGSQGLKPSFWSVRIACASKC